MRERVADQVLSIMYWLTINLAWHDMINAGEKAGPSDPSFTSYQDQITPETLPASWLCGVIRVPMASSKCIIKIRYSVFQQTWLFSKLLQNHKDDCCFPFPTARLCQWTLLCQGGKAGLYLKVMVRSWWLACMYEHQERSTEPCQYHHYQHEKRSKQQLRLLLSHNSHMPGEWNTFRNLFCMGAQFMSAWVPDSIPCLLLFVIVVCLFVCLLNADDINDMGWGRGSIKGKPSSEPAYSLMRPLDNQPNKQAMNNHHPTQHFHWPSPVFWLPDWHGSLFLLHT